MNDAQSAGGRLSLCVINYNGERYLDECLGALMALREQFLEILVVDNASTDRSLEIIRERFSSVRVLRLAENRGPAAARNAGYHIVGADRILFIDNDVMLHPGCSGRLLAALDRNPEAALAMPRVVYAGNRDTIQYDGAHNHFLGLMALENADRPLAGAPRETHEIGSIVTACFLIDRARWGGADPFDESFFIYLEDHDFGIRARAMGHRILSVPSAVCSHREGTEGLSMRRIGRYSRMRIFCLIRNRWQLLLKNYSLRSLVLLSPVLGLYEVAQVAVVLKRGWLLQWARALLWIVGHLPAIARKRRAIQHARSCDDRVFLEGGPIPFARELTRSRLDRAARAVLDRAAISYWSRISKWTGAGVPTLPQPLSERLDWRKIGRDSFLAFSSQSFYKIVGFIVLAVLTRYLSKEDMGVFFFAGTLAGFAALATQLGMGSYLTRETASHPEQALERFSEVISIRLPLFAMYLILLNGFALVFLREMSLIVFLTSIYVMLDEIYRTYGALFLGLKKVTFNVTAGVLSRILLVALILAVVWMKGSLSAVVLCYVAGNAFLLAIGHGMVVARIGSYRIFRSPTAVRETLERSTPIFVVAVLVLIHYKVDALMLGFMTTYPVVATYQAAYRLLDASRFLVLPVGMIFFPVFSEMAARREWIPIRDLVGRMLLTAAAVGVGLALGVGLLAGLIIPIVFGVKYDDSIVVLRILYVSMPTLFMTTVTSTVAYAAHLEKRFISIMAFCVLLNVALNAVAIPFWGANGAAVTTVITGAALCLWVTRLLFRELRIRRSAAAGAELSKAVDNAV